MKDVTIEVLRQGIDMTQRVVESLDRHFPQPEFVEVGKGYKFRHRHKDDLLLSYLKCVRSVSSLNACMVLLGQGYVQEMGVLCRCIEEHTEDVFFLVAPLGESGPSEQQAQMVQDFFQEEFDVPESPFLSTQKRNRVPRPKVTAGIARINGNTLNPSDMQDMGRTLYKGFSGYVHGAYGHIMESYGSTLGQPHYHMRGMSGTPRIQEWTNTLMSWVYRTMLAVECVCKRCDDPAATGAIQAARGSVENATGVGMEDPNRILKRLKKP